MRRLDQSLIISGLLHTFFTLSDIVNYRSLLQSYNQSVQIIVTLKCAFISRHLADRQTDIQQTARQTSSRQYKVFSNNLALRLLLIYIVNIYFQKFSCERNSSNSKQWSLTLLVISPLPSLIETFCFSSELDVYLLVWFQASLRSVIIMFHNSQDFLNHYLVGFRIEVIF